MSAQCYYKKDTPLVKYKSHLGFLEIEYMYTTYIQVLFSYVVKFVQIIFDKYCLHERNSCK